MNNIDVFNRVVASAFRQLYESFPKPTTLKAGDMRDDCGLSTEEDGWWEAKSNHMNPIGCALVWLNDEGFIRYLDQSGYTTFVNVVLTSKGFAALSKSPESLQSKPTIGQRFKELSKTASSESVSALVKFALGSAFGDQGS